MKFFFHYGPNYIIKRKNMVKMFIKVTFQIGVDNDDIDELSVLTQAETQLGKNRFISETQNENINMNEKTNDFFHDETGTKIFRPADVFRDENVVHEFFQTIFPVEKNQFQNVKQLCAFLRRIANRKKLAILIRVLIKIETNENENFFESSIQPFMTAYRFLHKKTMNHEHVERQRVTQTKKMKINYTYRRFIVIFEKNMRRW